jgi:hypothetical protein
LSADFFEGDVMPDAIVERAKELMGNLDRAAREEVEAKQSLDEYLGQQPVSRKDNVYGVTLPLSDGKWSKYREQGEGWAVRICVLAILKDGLLPLAATVHVESTLGTVKASLRGVAVGGAENVLLHLQGECADAVLADWRGRKSNA